MHEFYSCVTNLCLLSAVLQIPPDGHKLARCMNQVASHEVLLLEVLLSCNLCKRSFT